MNMQIERVPCSNNISACEIYQFATSRCFFVCFFWFLFVCLFVFCCCCSCFVVFDCLLFFVCLLLLFFLYNSICCVMYFSVWRIVQRA